MHCSSHVIHRVCSDLLISASNRRKGKFLRSDPANPESKISESRSTVLFGAKGCSGSPSRKIHIPAAVDEFNAEVNIMSLKSSESIRNQREVLHLHRAESSRGEEYTCGTQINTDDQGFLVMKGFTRVSRVSSVLEPKTHK
jgi:hypothetical protein